MPHSSQLLETQTVAPCRSGSDAVPPPWVAIVMPAYKTSKVIAAAVESALAQDYPNLVVGIAIPAHDGETLAAARAIADARVRVFEQTGKGIADARNLVLDNLEADLYMFLDSDDAMMPGVVSAYVAHRLATGVAGLRFGHYAEQMRDDPRPAWVRRAPLIGKVPAPFERLCLLNFIGPGAAMVDREVIDKVGLFDTRFHHAEDWHFWLRIAREYPLYGLDVVAYRYTYGKLALETPWPRAFFDDALRVVDDVGARGPIRALSRMCISAMYALYYFRTFAKRRTLVQLLDIRITDILALPPAAVVRALRGWGLI